ncbi:hypothetical protein SAMN02745121_01599 [Nannocystis exedens]|uniref:Uncharacterized protein n=1 Tax=Nannocystis exedens TaxID=54 RepID=A0A1I1V771_9BACT|nr:hypothetical protein [Nannocystis exedens]PCC72422.1 hypothetical protein NAEX_05502 [Nannocystis exedens]SFD78847.1 hypothetical protein SAMN02745121_01599 [Nannocystis exedens]
MMRTILMAAPFLAFALPLATASSVAARPLATPAPAAEFCRGDECGDESIELLICVEVQLAVDRDYECEIQRGPQCLANCTAEAMTPLCLHELGDRARSAAGLQACLAERAATCRSQCDGRGAAFCTEGARWDGGDDDDDDDDGDGGGPIFIDVDVCVWLDANF